jgi:hypothetical protein
MPPSPASRLLQGIAFQILGAGLPAMAIKQTHSDLNFDYGHPFCALALCFSQKTQEGNGMPNLPHAKNLRAGRYSESGQIYLLTAVVQHREPLFTDLRTGRLLVREHSECASRGSG